MGIEIERKWLLTKLPDGIDGFPHSEIIQGYLCTDPVIRIRKDGDKYYLTYKGRGEIKREEYDLPLNKEAFAGLRDKCDGVLIEKTRYRIPIDENGDILSDLPSEMPTESGCGNTCSADGGWRERLTAEVDVFKGKYTGLIYAEVEFADEAAAERFAEPSWFGEEVTHKAGYSNAELSLGR